jgi:hypothetical protein
MLGDLKDELLAVVLDVESIENLGELCGIELDCNLRVRKTEAHRTVQDSRYEPSTTAPMTY